MPRIFISCSHQDQHTLEILRGHLAPLQAQGLVHWWDDTEIQLGESWREHIETALRDASVAVLLISPAFLASDAIVSTQMPTLLERHERGELRLVPVYLSPSVVEACDFVLPRSKRRVKLTSFAGIASPERPLAACSPVQRDAEWVRLAHALVAETNLPTAASASPTTEPPPAPAETHRQPSACSPPQASRHARSTTGPTAAETRRYAWLALGSFVCTLALVGLWLWQGPHLAARGESRGVYYLVLVVLGCTVAAFLFGTLRSVGWYQGRVLHGSIEIGGPLLAAALVAWGGITSAPPVVGNFPLTVFVHGPRGPADLLPRGAGHVLVDLGGDRRRELIDDKGQARFAEVPGNFRGQSVMILLESVDYELAQARSTYVLDRHSLYLAVRRKESRVAGYVQDTRGHRVPNAHVTVAGQQQSTNWDGRFEVTIPGERVAGELMLEVQAPGYATWRSPVVPDSNQVGVLLEAGKDLP